VSDDSRSQFSAADAALGYLYQVRVALLWALRRLKSQTEFLVSIETLDDVTFETKGALLTSCFKRSIIVAGRPPYRVQARIYGNRFASGSKVTPRNPFPQAPLCIF
jgi:hypothetical protein